MGVVPPVVSWLALGSVWLQSERCDDRAYADADDDGLKQPHHVYHPMEACPASVIGQWQYGFVPNPDQLGAFGERREPLPES